MQLNGAFWIRMLRKTPLTPKSLIKTIVLISVERSFSVWLSMRKITVKKKIAINLLNICLFVTFSLSLSPIYLFLCISYLSLSHPFSLWRCIGRTQTAAWRYEALHIRWVRIILQLIIWRIMSFNSLVLHSHLSKPDMFFFLL